jgi:hypothetical protein
MSCDVCRKAGSDIAGKTEFVTGKKKFKRESLVYHNKSINKDTNSYYITPIYIYFFGNNKGNFIISPISFFSDCFSKD